MAEKGKGGTIKETDMERLWNDGFRLVVVYMDLSRTEMEEYQKLFGAQGTYDRRGKRLFIPIPEPKSTSD